MNNIEKVNLLIDKKISEMTKEEIKQVEEVIQIFAERESNGRRYTATTDDMINGIYSYNYDLSYPSFMNRDNFKITHIRNIMYSTYEDEYLRIYDFINSNGMNATKENITEIQVSTFENELSMYNNIYVDSKIDWIKVTGNFEIIEKDNIEYYSFNSDNIEYVIPINRIVGVRYLNKVFNIDINFKGERSFPKEIISEQNYKNSGLKDYGYTENESIDDIGYFKLFELKEKMLEEQLKYQEKIQKEIEEKEELERIEKERLEKEENGKIKLIEFK